MCPTFIRRLLLIQRRGLDVKGNEQKRQLEIEDFIPRGVVQPHQKGVTMRRGIGILLTDRSNDDQVAMIEFTPVGLLRFQTIAEGVHVFALKPIEGILSENGLKVPLYKKHASLLRRGKLPLEILEREAEFYADVLNHQQPPLSIGGKTIKATMVQFSTQSPKPKTKAKTASR